MKNLTIRSTNTSDAKHVFNLMKQYWGGEPLIIKANNYYPSKLDGFLAETENNKIGFIFYETKDYSCEIVALEALDKFKGVGSKLLDKVRKISAERNCKRICLTTNNDNMDALRFYQRRGFVVHKYHYNTLEYARKLKPEIPEIGDYGIPLRDEIDLELILNSD